MARCICTVLALLAFIATTQAVPVDSSLTRVHDVAGYVRRSVETTQMPDTLDLNFQVRDENVVLNLTRNLHVDSKAPVVLGRRGKFSKWTDMGEEDFAVYLDLGNYAAFLVESDKDAVGKPVRSYRGSFRLGSEEYVLEPTVEQRSRRRRSINLGDVTSVVHRVYKRELEEMVFEGDANLRPNISEYTKYQDEIVSLGRETLGQDDGKKTYGVEFYLFLDYAIYDKWYLASAESSPEAKEQDAIDNIRYYFSHVANGVDMRYQSIDEPDFGIYTRLQGFYIATTPEDAPWTEDPSIKESGNPRDYTEAYKGLDAFELWISENEDQFAPFDQATLFTGYILFGGLNSDGSRRSISGLADIKGVCNYFKCSINQDVGQYGSIQTAAHEMGHNLGADHDSTSKNSCSPKDQFVMASAPGVLTDDNYKNAFTFSQCSRQAFRDFLFFLDQEGDNCLTNPAETQDKDEFESNLQVLPGQKYSPDQQCEMILGPGAYYCGGDPNDKNMCREMLCYSPEKDACYSNSEQRAADGTTCGNKKWCLAADCVDDDKAPDAEDFCLYGDFKGTYIDGRTCESITTDTPWECYSEPYSNDCCESCAALRDDTKPGCEFGDHNGYCTGNEVKDCYELDTQETCCAFCESVKKDQEGCEYGDRASWCSADDLSGCYGDFDTCCETCAANAEEHEGCEWGDKASWCAGQEKRKCYTNEDSCCSTCKELSSGIEGCEYGDKDQYCSPDQCSDQYSIDNCCETCHTQFVARQTPKPDSNCKDEASWCSTMPDHDCYVSEDVCCATCREKGGDKTECKFGDKASWCKDYVTKGEHCERQDIADVCCNTCATIMKKKELECQDEASWCRYISLQQCANEAVNKTCCSRCDGAEPSVCKDEASWCKTVEPSYCYVYNIAKTCCASCWKKRQGPKGCEYGDKATWCPSMDKRLCATTGDTCCESCK